MTRLPASVPLVTAGLIAACVWVYVWQLAIGEDGFRRAVYAFGLVPAVLTGHATLPASVDLVFPPATLLTAVFLHDGLGALLANVLYLWLFGARLEDAFGRARYAGFLAFCAAAAALAQTAGAPASVVPMIGAGGTVSAVLGACWLLHPRASVTLALPAAVTARTLRMPAGTLMALWFAAQLAGALLAHPGSPGVAWTGHLGGLLIGALLAPFLKRPHVRLLGPEEPS